MRRLACLVMILLSCALLTFTQGRRTDQQLAALLAGSYDPRPTPLNVSLRDSLRVLADQTDYAEKWQLNQPYLPERLNVYIVDSRRSVSRAWAERFENLVMNCSTTPYGALLVCDLALVDQLNSKINRELRSLEGERDRVLLLEWMLAHELGHLVLQHTGVHYFSEPIANRRPISEVYVEEQEADTFAASRLFTRANRLETEVMLITLANAEIRRLTGEPQYGAGLLYDYEKPIPYTTQCSHPAYVIRAVQLLKTSATLRNDEGLAAMLRPLDRIFADDGKECNVGE